MAKVIFGQGIAGVKGAVGGSVFQKVRSFYIMKQKGIPTNPKTSFQAGVRAFFTTVSKKWSTISDSDRLSWNKKADGTSVASKKKSFGGGQKLSGKALFQEVNQNLLLAGEVLVDTPPAIGTTNTTKITSVEIDKSAGGLNVLFDGATDNDAIMLISTTGPLSAGTTYKKGKFKKIYGKKVAKGTTKIDIGTEYILRFGPYPPAGANVSFEVRQVTSTGYNDTILEPKTTFVT